MDNERIQYDMRNPSTIEKLYLNSGMLFYCIAWIVLVVVGIFYVFILKTSILAFGLFFAAYTCFCVFYMKMYLNGKKNMVFRATLENDVITAETQAGTRQIQVADVKLCIGYATNGFASTVLITDFDYLVLNMSSVYIFSKQGKRVITPYYAISRYCRDHAQRFENVVKSNRTKRHPWIKVPYKVFEWDLRSERVERYIEKLMTLEKENPKDDMREGC